MVEPAPEPLLFASGDPLKSPPLGLPLTRHIETPARRDPAAPDVTTRVSTPRRTLPPRGIYPSGASVEARRLLAALALHDVP